MSTYNLSPEAIDAIRDLAIKKEVSNIKLAYEHMSVAYCERPTGTFIKSKLAEYKGILKNFFQIQRLNLRG